MQRASWPLRSPNPCVDSVRARRPRSTIPTAGPLAVNSHRRPSVDASLHIQSSFSSVDSAISFVPGSLAMIVGSAKRHKPCRRRFIFVSPNGECAKRSILLVDLIAGWGVPASSGVRCAGVERRACGTRALSYGSVEPFSHAFVVPWAVRIGRRSKPTLLTSPTSTP
jgi:hypothetical protein